MHTWSAVQDKERRKLKVGRWAANGFTCPPLAILPMHVAVVVVFVAHAVAVPVPPVVVVVAVAAVAADQRPKRSESERDGKRAPPTVRARGE